MHPALSAHRAAVAALCRLSGVKRLELFGSAARDDFDPGRSDFDFLVEFDDSDQGDPLQSYFGLLSVNLPSGEVCEGLHAGLSDDGALQLRLADGAIRAIHAADIFLI